VKSEGEALVAALPAGGVSQDNDFRLAVFALARQLKAVPRLRDCEAPELKRLVRHWYGQAAGHLGGRTFAEVYASFIPAWGAVIHPAGDDPVKLAWDIVSRRPLPPEAEEYGDARVGLTIALCRQLQHQNEITARREGFFLRGYQLAELLGVKQPTAAKLLAMLVEEGHLEVIEDGGGFCGGHRMAREYRVAPPGWSAEESDLEPRDEADGAWGGEPDAPF
jgi:hypothetical protein